MKVPSSGALSYAFLTGAGFIYNATSVRNEKGRQADSCSTEMLDVVFYQRTEQFETGLNYVTSNRKNVSRHYDCRDR